MGPRPALSPTPRSIDLRFHLVGFPSGLPESDYARRNEDKLTAAASINGKFVDMFLCECLP